MDTKTRSVLFGVLVVVIATVAVWNYVVMKSAGEEPGFMRDNHAEEIRLPIEDGRDTADRVDIAIGGGPPPVLEVQANPVGHYGDEHPVDTDAEFGEATLSMSPTGIPLPTQYEMQTEDTLISVSKKFYGTPNRWRTIAEANGIARPERISIGTVLTIPALGESPATNTTSTDSSGANDTAAVPANGEAFYHTVQLNDNLWDIAKKYYGSGTQNRKIIDANPGLNPSRLKPGQKILIPDRQQAN